MRAAQVRAAPVGAALADSPREPTAIRQACSGTRRERSPLPLAQPPADRVGQPIPAAGASSSSRATSPSLAPAPSAVTISLRRNPAGTAAIAASSSTR